VAKPAAQSADIPLTTEKPFPAGAACRANIVAGPPAKDSSTGIITFCGRASHPQAASLKLLALVGKNGLNGVA
jgi:hypothetical protein